MSTYIYGKIFASMFEGSLCGAGSDVFAVMAYVIARMQPDHLGEEYVRLHPNLLCTAIGAKEEAIIKAIKFLCKEDAQTTTDGESGRRLVMESPYVYRVVNGKYYRGMMNDEDRRTKAAIRQKRFRDKKKLADSGGGAAMPSSVSFERLAESHGQEAANRLADRQQEEAEENRRELNGQAAHNFEPVKTVQEEGKVVTVIENTPVLTGPESAGAPVGAIPAVEPLRVRKAFEV